MMVFMVAGALWRCEWKGEFGNQRALGCVSRDFNQVTRGTPALLRGGDLLQLGLGHGEELLVPGRVTQRVRHCGCAGRLLFLGKSQPWVLAGAEFLWECCIPLGMVPSSWGNVTNTAM